MNRLERHETVRSLLRTLDHHSPGELAHAERVAVLSVAIAEKLGWDDDALLQMRDAAMLHDVGKVRVDPALLRKIGTLDEGEIEALHLHAVLCEHLLAEFEFLRPCIRWIRHHHESWDGCGYPDGLIGLEIPQGARILSLAEAFDVLAYGATYRQPSLEDAALREIHACSGRQFDPALVKILDEVHPLIQPLI